MNLLFNIYNATFYIFMSGSFYSTQNYVLLAVSLVTIEADFKKLSDTIIILSFISFIILMHTKIAIRQFWNYPRICD